MRKSYLLLDKLNKTDLNHDFQLDQYKNVLNFFSVYVHLQKCLDYIFFKNYSNTTDLYG